MQANSETNVDPLSAARMPPPFVRRVLCPRRVVAVVVCFLCAMCYFVCSRERGAPEGGRVVELPEGGPVGAVLQAHAE
eukprot:9484232-Pyramimonas_sp.AAC.2